LDKKIKSFLSYFSKKDAYILTLRFITLVFFMDTTKIRRLLLWKTEKAVEKVDKANIAQTGLGLSDF